MEYRILVTGGSGFIGTHLCRRLLDEGRRVRILDLQPSRLASKELEVIPGDVRDPATVEKAMKGVTCVIHLAALVAVPLCQEQPLESYRTNLLGTAVLLEALRREEGNQKKRIRFLFASSSAVYGNSGRPGESLKESELRDEPRSFYAAQKLASEHLIRNFRSAHGVEALCFRFFNVYGPGQDPSSPYSGVISIFSRRIREGQPLALNGGGAQTRDFVSVHDIARALALSIDIPGASCAGQSVNLGSGRSITIRELAETLLESSSLAPVPLVNAPARDGDVLHSQADTSLAQELLGWSANLPISEGLAELLR